MISLSSTAHSSWRGTTSEASIFLTDALGSTVALTDSLGAVQTQYTYEPFGQTTATSAASPNPFQYTGRENDGTGLYYYRARYYHPALQRFVSEDPLDFLAGDVNFYAYGSNSPTNFTDSTGLVVDIVVDAALIGYDIYSLFTGGRKDLAVNSLALGGDIVGAIVPGLTGVGPAIRSARAAKAATKAVNLPAWRKIAINLPHIAERHMAEGALTAGRHVFPAHMTQAAVERAVRQAYRYGEKVATQGERVLVRGEAYGLTIEMWVNRATKTIETAYPLAR